MSLRRPRTGDLVTSDVEEPDARFTEHAAVTQNRPMSEEAQQRERSPWPKRRRSIFEQPLNERMRTFLRLDFLYNQALYHNEMQSQWGSRAAMASLLDMLAIATRGDVRSDVLKELERHLAQLNEFQSKPGVDSARLRTRDVATCCACAPTWSPAARPTCSHCAIRNSSPPSSIAAPFPAAPANSTCRITSSGSTRRPMRARDSFNDWLAMLRPLCDAIAELLWLTRQKGGRARRSPWWRLRHQLRSRHAVPAAAHRAAGESRVVSGDQREPLSLLGAIARVERPSGTPGSNY